MINKINASSGVNVFFDEGKQKFSIAAKNTGNINTGTDPDNEPEIILTGALFTDVMKMGANNNSDVNIGTDLIPINVKAGAPGKNAILTYNGLEIERSSNTFTINGAKLTLKKDNGRWRCASYFFLHSRCRCNL